MLTAIPAQTALKCVATIVLRLIIAMITIGLLRATPTHILLRTMPPHILLSVVPTSAVATSLARLWLYRQLISSTTNL